MLSFSLMVQNAKICGLLHSFVGIIKLTLIQFLININFMLIIQISTHIWAESQAKFSNNSINVS
jgi:hypothetical protein